MSKTYKTKPQSCQSVYDTGSAVEEVCRLLKPSGMAFISIWNRFWPNSWLKWLYLYFLRYVGLQSHGSGNRVCWESGESVLWHYFTPSEASRLFLKHGFFIVDKIPFEGSWEGNRVVKKSVFSAFFLKAYIML